jgi:UDP-N-acetylmuramyl pentapeptide phosphotransferase/UDP-N-acetylglucosamine-1-phosphate transferase
MDGINGISGTQAAAAGGFLALVARHVQLNEIELAAWAMTGAAVGFLPFNAVRPKVFLGDVGSYGIGFWLAACALKLLDHGVSPLVLAGPFVLYLGDTSAVLVRRWRRGESLFEAHREHAYQLLVRSGWSHLAVSSLCLAITLATSFATFAVVDQSFMVQFLTLAASVLIVAIYLRFASTRYRLRGGAAA